MAAGNSDEAVERNLRKCYQVDIDWNLVPTKLQNVSPGSTVALKFSVLIPGLQTASAGITIV